MKLKLNKRIVAAVVTAFCFAAMLCGCGSNDEVMELLEANCDEYPSDVEEAGALSSSMQESDLKEQTIFVYICGEVERPGVYELPSGSRLYEVVNRAGGLTGAADENSLNQAAVVSDGQQIYVPKKGEESISGEAKTSSALININTADEAALCSITGIGASRAADIVAYRQANGPFGSIEDIMKVSGIKEGLFAKIKDQITV